MEDKKTYPLTIKLSQAASDELLAFLKKSSPLHFYESGSKLFYESQVPVVAYILVEGEITLKQNGKARDHIKDVSLIGLAQMVKGKNSPLSAEVTKKSKIYYLDKSHYKELFQASEASEIKGIISDILEAN
jgi:CRP-like cAMP-binding protein